MAPLCSGAHTQKIPAPSAESLVANRIG